MIKHQYRMSDLHTIKDLTEYFRDGIIDAVAETFPYKLSQPPGSEELYGNTIQAVAHLPRKRGTAAFIF